MIFFSFLSIILIMACISNTNTHNSTVDLDKVKKATKYTIYAEVVDKYIADDMTYVVFKSNNQKISLLVGSDIYGELSIGDVGDLYYGIYKDMKIFGSFTPTI